MVSSIAVQAWTVAVLALLRSRSALGSPHRNLPPKVYATDDAVTRSPGGLPNATTSDRYVRTGHGRHSSYDGGLIGMMTDDKRLFWFEYVKNRFFCNK